MKINNPLRLKLTLICCALTICGHTRAQNLITNPDFSVGTTGWSKTFFLNTVNSTSTLAASFPNLTSGDAAFFTNTNSSPNGTGNHFLSQQINLPTSGSYQLSYSYGFRTGGAPIAGNTGTATVSFGGVNIASYQLLNNGADGTPFTYNKIMNGVTSFQTLNSVATLTTPTRYVGWSSETINLSLQQGVKELKFFYSFFDTSFILDNVSLIFLGILGPSTADTQASLVNTAASLKNVFTLQNSALSNSFAYDCTLFDKNNICVSAGGRYTAVHKDGLNQTSALLIGAYRLSPNYRVGAYFDQNLSVNHVGSTVSLGNSTPLMGLFGVWNERLDGTGTEVKVSAAYGQKSTTVNRQVVGTSEAGSGSSNLDSQGVQLVAKYGFGVAPDVIVSPYAGVRYTQNNMGGYTEASSSSVTAPLTYRALNTNATTLLAGVGTTYRVVPQATLFASAGVETDTNINSGSYSATGVSDLTPVNFNSNPVKTRGTAMLGGYYDIQKNHRVGITAIYRQEPFKSVSTTSVLATYTVGL